MAPEQQTLLQLHPIAKKGGAQDESLAADVTSSQCFVLQSHY